MTLSSGGRLDIRDRPMLRFLLAVVFSVIVVAGCKSNRAAYNASFVNKTSIGSIQLGQSMEQVRTIMGKEPESTAASLLDNGVYETVWYYLTDYDSMTNTAITFHNDKVVAIAASKWLGDGNFSGGRSR